MSVLIGIVSKNRASILPKAIDSAFNQSFQNIEISVFDDASTDDTKLLENQYPNVEWNFSATPKGYLFARNKFMSESNEKYFCSLDDDAWFINGDEIALAVDYLENNLDTAAIAFDILSPDKSESKARTLPYETNMFIGCGHVLRLSAVKEAGFYEPNPGFYGGEEKDLCIKLIDLGYKIVKMPGVLVWHDKTSVARDLPKQHRSGVCNDMVFMYRRTPIKYLIPAMIIKPLNHLKFSLFYKNGILLKAGILGLIDFYLLLLSFKLNRKSVKVSTFLHYRALSAIR